MEFYFDLSIASCSLNSPDSVLQQRSQNELLHVSSPRGVYTSFNNTYTSETSLFVTQTLHNYETASYCLDLPTQPRRLRVIFDAEIFRKCEWKAIFQSYETHSVLIKMYYHREREALGRIRSDWDWR